MNELISNEAVYTTAPATPGLLTKYNSQYSIRLKVFNTFSRDTQASPPPRFKNPFLHIEEK